MRTLEWRRRCFVKRATGLSTHLTRGGKRIAGSLSLAERSSMRSSFHRSRCTCHVPSPNAATGCKLSERCGARRRAMMQSSTSPGDHGELRFGPPAVIDDALRRMGATALVDGAARLLEWSARPNARAAGIGRDKRSRPRQAECERGSRETRKIEFAPVASSAARRQSRGQEGHALRVWTTRTKAQDRQIAASRGRVHESMGST